MIKDPKPVKQYICGGVCKPRPPVKYPEWHRKVRPTSPHPYYYVIIHLELNLTQNSRAWKSIGEYTHIWSGKNTHIIACGVIKTTPNNHPSHVGCSLLNAQCSVLNVPCSVLNVPYSRPPACSRTPARSPQVPHTPVHPPTLPHMTRTRCTHLQNKPKV